MSMPGFAAESSLYKTAQAYRAHSGAMNVTIARTGDYLDLAQLAFPPASAPCDCHQCYQWCGGHCFQECRTPLGVNGFCYAYCMEVCTGGCDSWCGPGFVRCGHACVDLTSDPNNCGRCGTHCQACQNGTCICLGLTPTNCNGICTSLLDDPANCGRCGHRCQPNQFCGPEAGGTCTTI